MRRREVAMFLIGITNKLDKMKDTFFAIFVRITRQIFRIILLHQ